MKKYRYLILTVVLAVFVGLTILLWHPLTAFVSNPESLRRWVQGTGIWGAMVFGLLNIVQVVFAVIPGAPFEIAAGYMFGVLPGTLLCDATMTIASVLVFLLVRKFGMNFVELFIPWKQMESIHFLNDTQRVQSILFLVFLIPATPKDVVTYLAGLTDLPLKSWIFVCFVGRFPGIVAAVIVVFAVCYLVGLKWYKRCNIQTKKEK